MPQILLGAELRRRALARPPPPLRGFPARAGGKLLRVKGYCE